MADVEVELAWAGGLRFTGGRPAGAAIAVDGNRSDDPTPVELLLVSLTACIAADIADIAGKMRVPIARLEARAEGDRAANPPRRYTRVALRFVVAGAAEADEPKLRRALDLSREKYCSVLHTLRSDLMVELSLALVPA
jgi:putative redox protein